MIEQAGKGMREKFCWNSECEMHNQKLVNTQISAHQTLFSTFHITASNAFAAACMKLEGGNLGIRIAIVHIWAHFFDLLSTYHFKVFSLRVPIAFLFRSSAAVWVWAAQCTRNDLVNSKSGKIEYQIFRCKIKSKTILDKSNFDEQREFFKLSLSAYNNSWCRQWGPLEYEGVNANDKIRAIADCCHECDRKCGNTNEYRRERKKRWWEKSERAEQNEVRWNINIMLKLNTRWAMTYTLNMKCDYDRCAHDKNTNKVEPVMCTMQTKYKGFSRCVYG